MATVYNLEAADCPPIVVPAAPLLVSDETPGVFAPFALGDTTSVPGDLNTNAARSELIGRHGCGAYAIAWGSGPDDSTPACEVTVDSGLTVLVGVGTVMLDGPVQVEEPIEVNLTDDTAPVYLWLTQAGTVTQVNEDTTPPAGAVAYLGAVTTDSGAVTEIDGSGVLYLIGPQLWRRTADTTEPADTPPASLSLLHQGDGAWWLWTGSAYLAFATSGAELAVAAGGTGAGTAAGARANLGAAPAAGYALVIDGDGDTDVDGLAGAAFACMDLDTTSGGAYTINWPNLSDGITPGRHWLVFNADTTYAATCKVKGESGSGVTVPALTAAYVFVSDGYEMRGGVLS